MVISENPNRRKDHELSTAERRANRRALRLLDAYIVTRVEASTGTHHNLLEIGQLGELGEELEAERLLKYTLSKGSRPIMFVD